MGIYDTPRRESPNDPVKWAAAHDNQSQQELPAAPLERLVGQESSLDMQEGISTMVNSATIVVKINGKDVFELSTGKGCLNKENTMCKLDDLPFVIEAIDNAANFCRIHHQALMTRMESRSRTIGQCESKMTPEQREKWDAIAAENTKNFDEFIRWKQMIDEAHCSK